MNVNSQYDQGVTNLDMIETASLDATRPLNATNEKDTQSIFITARPSHRGQPSIMVMKAKPLNNPSILTSIQADNKVKLDLRCQGNIIFANVFYVYNETPIYYIKHATFFIYRYSNRTILYK